MSNSQLKKLISGIKNGTEVTLNFSWNVIGISNDEYKFPHKLLLTNTQVSRLRKSFANNSPANIKLSKNQQNKIGQSGGFPVRLLGPSLKTVSLLLKNILKALAKSVLMALGLTATVSATDADIQNKAFRTGMTKLIISNEEMTNIIKIFKSLKNLAYL